MLIWIRDILTGIWILILSTTGAFNKLTSRTSELLASLLLTMTLSRSAWLVGLILLLLLHIVVILRSLRLSSVSVWDQRTRIQLLLCWIVLCGVVCHDFRLATVLS